MSRGPKGQNISSLPKGMTLGLRTTYQLHRRSTAGNSDCRDGPLGEIEC